MRDDMAKMLVETHRAGGHGDSAHKKRARDRDTDLESLPSREGIREYTDQRSFGENFPPLLGFLRKNCGRNWDKVYSELSASLIGGGTNIEHTKTHLFRDFVELKPQWVDGKPYYSGTDFNGRPDPIREGYFYIDQQNRLQVAKPKRKAQVQPKPRDYINEDGIEYLKINDVWFLIETKQVPDAIDGSLLHDVVLGKLLPKKMGYRKTYWQWEAKNKDVAELWRLYSRNGKRYATSKRQVSSKTIKNKNLNKPR